MQSNAIEQVAATMAVENMPLSRDCYKNLRSMASGENSRASYSGDHREVQEEGLGKRIIEGNFDFEQQCADVWASAHLLTVF